MLEGDLEGLLHGGGAVAGEQQVGVVHGHHRGQRLRQLHHHPVPVAEERGVGDPAELGPDGVVQLGHPVPEGRHPQ